jgi:hypothetical protein
LKFFLTKRRLAVVAALLLVAVLCLVRPGANQLRTRIVSSISMAVGRPVEVATVNLRLLPQPGFDLENFVMRDDPAFGAEPVVRAQEVTAVLRFSSLLRGRLEVSRLNLAEPSLNLVRNAEGHWNLESLLQRAAETAVAPTGKTKDEARFAFPYIEASDARINFKFGHEKLPHALTSADFSLWQDSENTWGMRMEAQPVRTDFNLSDTGTLKVSGSWQRSASLRQTPLKFNLQWNSAQLGQMTKLAYGDDKGWRGSMAISMALTGTPADLQVATTASVQDFRRYDIVSGGPLLLVVRCGARYRPFDRFLSEVDCHSPVGEGEIALKGETTLYHPSTYDLAVSARDVPVQGLVSLLRRVKGDVPKDLIAGGRLNGKIGVLRKEAGSETRWQGEGNATDFHLASKSTKADLSLERIHFAVSEIALDHSPALDIGPIAIAMGGPAPIAIRARLARSGYNVQVQGNAQVRRLLQSAETVGLPVAKISADGPVKVDLQIAGEWRGFAAPNITGKAQLHAVHADVAEFNQPVEIEAANIVLSPERTRVSNITALLAGGTWRGWLDAPRPCNREIKCTVHFNLAADKIDTALLRQAAPGRERAWYKFLPSSKKSPQTFLASLHASGKIATGRLVIQRLTVNHVSTDAVIEEGVLNLYNLQAELMGSVHHGNWTADFSKQPAAYSGSGTFDEVDLEQLSTSMRTDWITGTAGASYEVKATGTSLADLLQSATGALTVEAREGTLPYLMLTNMPLAFERFTGKFLLNGGKLEIGDGKLQSADITYQVVGSASLANQLDLRLIRNTGRGFTVTGSVSAPRVEPALFPETQAALKP